MSVQDQLRRAYALPMKARPHDSGAFFEALVCDDGDMSDDDYSLHLRSYLNAYKDQYGAHAAVDLLLTAAIGAGSSTRSMVNPQRAQQLARHVNGVSVFDFRDLEDKRVGALIALSCIDPSILNKYAPNNFDAHALLPFCRARASMGMDGVEGARSRNVLVALEEAGWLKDQVFLHALYAHDSLSDLSFLNMQLLGMLGQQDKYRGFNALHVAVSMGLKDAVNGLISRGHDLEAVHDVQGSPHNGLTALGYAVVLGAEPAIVGALVSAGADISKNHPSGRSLLQIASKNEEVKRILRASACERGVVDEIEAGLADFGPANRVPSRSMSL